MAEILYLLDTQRILVAGASSTIYAQSGFAITTATIREIQQKNLRLDREKLTEINSPTFSDFTVQYPSYFIWSDENNNTLQMIQYEERQHISSTCGNKHFAIVQLTKVGEGQPIYICEGVLRKPADFSQVTAVFLYDNVKHYGTGDRCLRTIVQSVDARKNKVK